MNCSACGNENSEDVQFCRSCGTSLSVRSGIGVEAVQDNSTRYHGLDALRGMAMLLGIVLHAALPYIGAGDFWPSDRSSSPLINTLFHFIHIWRMPLFFILAGFFAHLIIDKHSWKAWWGNRFLRVGLPLMVFTPLASLTLPWIFSYGKTETLVFFYSNDGQPYHLWFMWHLIIFTALTVIFRPFYLLCTRVLNGLEGIGIGLIKQLIQNTQLLLSTVIFQSRFPIVFIAICFFVNIPFGGELITNPAASSLYFILGYSLFTNHSLFTFIKSHWNYYLFIATVLFGFYMIAYIPEVKDFLKEIFPRIMIINEGKESSLFDVMQYSSRIACAILFSYAFIGLAEHKFGSYSSRLKFVSDGAYWIYLVHLPLVTLITFFMFRLHIPIEIKFIIATVLTSIICLGTYKYFVRSTFIGVLLNGKRHSSKMPET